MDNSDQRRIGEPRFGFTTYLVCSKEQNDTGAHFLSYWTSNLLGRPFGGNPKSFVFLINPLRKRGKSTDDVSASPYTFIWLRVFVYCPPNRESITKGSVMQMEVMCQLLHICIYNSPSFVDFSADWDVHWELTGILTTTGRIDFL